MGDIRPTLLVLASGAGLLLLIAYVNVASLLLVRAESRKRETVLRGVLGASVGRLIRQFVTEGVLLVAVALALGMPAASAAIPRLFSLIPERRLRGMPYFRDAGLHPRVLLFAAAVSLLAVVVFSVTPVLRLSLSNLRADLAEGGRGSAGTLWKRFGVEPGGGGAGDRDGAAGERGAVGEEPLPHVPCGFEFPSGESGHAGDRRSWRGL